MSKAGKVPEKQNKAYKQKSKATYRRRKTMKASRLTMEFLTPAMRRQGFTQTEIISRWPRIVGSDIAESVVPIKISFPRNKRSEGTLLVRCESAFAPKLAHRIPVIIESVNSYYGYLAVAQVQIQQGPLPKKRFRLSSKPLQPSRAAISQVGSIVGDAKSEGLRGALQSLGEQVLAKEEKLKK